MLEPGTPIGDWIVEEPADGSDRYRCHRRDTPFRKALLRVVRAVDATRAQQEAESLARLHHPNIQGVLGLAASGDDLYLVTEAVTGATLDAFVRQPPLPLRAAIDVAVQLADALAATHSRGLVHGDVRPANVLLSPDGRALLVGFDLRSSLGTDPSSPYAAPEGGPPGPKHDAYGFGVLLYELMTGTRVAPVPPPERRSLSFELSLPAALREVLVRLTSPDPELRCSLQQAHDALAFARRESLGDRSTSGSAETTFADGGLDLSAEGAAPGQIGRYRVVRELGRGGVGVVYEAEDPDLKRKVALKVLLAGSFARARDIARFRKEAQAVARLDHPAIVKILDMGVQQDATWFAMEFVDGPTLLDRIRAEPRLGWREVVRVGAELAQALRHAHDAGLVHRDVKPNNVLLEGGKRPKLTDFGLALDEEHEATRLTRTGQVLGTPMYMSPEQAAGDLDQLGPHSDVYALGVVLYEALCGKVPFDGATPLAVIGKVLAGNPKPLRDHVPDLPRALEIVVLKAMRRDRADRYPSAGALADDLERVLRGEPILAAAPTLLDRTRWFLRRNRAEIGVAAIVLVAALGVLGGTSAVLEWRASAANAQREAATRTSLASVQRRMDAAVAEGRPDVAEAAWQTFVRQPEHRGTAALVDGWLARADGFARDGDGGQRLSALASAYAASVDGEAQQRVLLALGRALRDERRFDVLPMVVDMFVERAPGRAEEVADLARDALAAHRDFAGAAARGPDDAVGRVLRSLAAATRTEHAASFVTPWPGGGLLLRDGDSERPRVVAATAALPVVRELRLPVPLGGGGPYVVPGTPPRLLGAVPQGGAVLLRVDDDHVRFEASWPTGSLADAVSDDLDGDGVVETYYGSVRELYRVRPGASGWVHDAPSAEVEASDSVIKDLALGDLDGDGVRELVVGAGEWSAYDVRSLEAGGGGLALSDRRKLGVVTAVGVVSGPEGRDHVLAAKVDMWANLRVFPAESPYGEAAGVWDLAVRADGRLDGERIDGSTCHSVLTGDLDGDGMGDAVLGCAGDLLVLVRRADGGWDDVRVRRLTPHALLQLDEDAAAELVVADPDDGGRLWVLGAGTDEPPYLLRTNHASEVPPEDADPGVRAAWQRAEDLVFAGQLDPAAAALRDLADMRWGEPAGTRALLRAADLHAARKAWGEAADLYLLAAGQGAAEGLPAAARALRHAADPERELDVLRRLRDAGALEPELADRLAVLAPLATLPALELTFDAPLDPRWEVLDPLAVRRDRGALAIEAMGTAVLARLPVEWDGGWLRVEVEATLERAEWDGGLAIGLVPRGTSEPLRGVRLDGRGGGELVWERLQCLGAERAVDRDVPKDVPLVAVAAIQPDGTTSCTLRREGAPDWRASTPDAAGDPAEGPWDLAIVAVGQPSALAVARVQRVRVAGASVARDAVAVAAPAEPVDRLDRTALVAQIREGVDERTLLHLAHARLDEAGDALREALGERWPATFLAAWSTTLHAQSTTDAVAQRALLDELPGLEAVEPATREDTVAVAVLLGLRGAAATRAGKDELARANLERALVLAGRVPDDAEVASRATQARVDLAVLDVRVGRRDDAFRRLAEAIRAAGSPAVAADGVSARADLGALRADPRWDEVVERARRGG